MRASLPSFHDAGGLAVDFPEPVDTDLALAFLVGPNGSGKSRLLEAMGHVFAHLAVGVPPGFRFELEYEVAGSRILVTTERDRLGWLDERPRLPQVGAWLLVAELPFEEWSLEHVMRAWPTYLDGILPYRVVGISSGPASQLQWALEKSVSGTLSLSLETDEEHVRDQLQELATQPRCFAVDGPELVFALLALLTHAESRSGEDEERDLILAKAGLSVRSLVAFSFEVAADWRELLPEGERQTFLTLIEAAVRSVNIVRSDEDVDSRDFRAVYVPDRHLREAIAEWATAPFHWFSRLQSWAKAGALRAPKLVLAAADRQGLVRDVDLSDGEFLYVGRYALLLLLRRHEGCLVLLDEPETHFNDRWKVDLVDDMERILRGNAAQIVLATHSDLTLTDADQSDVFVFAKDREVGLVTPEAPSISPLAADRGEITQHVMGADTAIGKRAERIVEEALRRGGVDALDSTLERLGPGFQRFRIRYAIEEAREAGDDP